MVHARRPTPSQPPEPPPSSTGAGSRDWSELPLDALVEVFAHLGPVEILLGAGLVCRAWLGAAKEPELWTTLDMATHGAVEGLDAAALRAMARAAADRAGGRLEAFSAKYFATDGLLAHVARTSAGSLRRLRLVACGEVTNRGFAGLVAASPLLEDLALELCPRVGGRGAYERAGAACPRLRSFRLRRECFRFSRDSPRRVAEARGIAAMARLRSLTLVSCNVNNDELVAVLDGCPRLEALCLRDCYKVIADAALRARCAGIKTLTLPGYGD